MFGSKDSLISKGAQFFYQDTPGVPGKAEPNDSFGHRLAAADFNGDGYSDLAVSAPNDAVGKLSSAGTVTVFYGTSLGLVTDTVQFFQQDSKGVMGIANLGDGFRLALGAGDLNTLICKGSTADLLATLGPEKTAACLEASAGGLRSAILITVTIFAVAGVIYLLTCKTLQRDLVAKLS